MENVKMCFAAIILIFMSLELLGEEKSSDKNFAHPSISIIGLNYGFGQNDSQSNAGFDIQIKEQIKSFVVGIDLDIIYGLNGEAKKYSFASFRPSIGVFLFGNSESNFKFLMSVSSGLGQTQRGESTYYGTVSTLGFDIVYKDFGIYLGNHFINTSIYSNSFNQIGLRYWL